MTISRDAKILEAILFASGIPVTEEDLKEKMNNKNIPKCVVVLLQIINQKKYSPFLIFFRI